jgi:hypothetical protein
VTVAELQPRRHEPPAGWDAQTFECVTDALAAALVTRYRQRDQASGDERGPTETAR